MMIHKRMTCLFFCLMCCLVHIKAQSKTHVNSLDEKKWEEISSGLDYSEKDEKPAKKKDLKTNTSFNFDFSFLEPVKVIVYILIIAALAFILVRIILSINNRNQTVKKNIRIDLEEDLKEENISEWPLQHLLNQFIQEGDIRNAIRIYYLMSLQLLHLNGWIKWEKDKTNSRYVLEFSAHERALDFSMLTKIYETTWYGQFFPDESMFQIAKKQFTMFNAQFPMPDEK